MSLTLVASFAERFNTLIESSSKSATQIANDLGVSKQAISTWRTGRISPKRPTIEAICLYFRVSPAWLCGYDVPMRLDESGEISSVKKEVLAFIDTLSDDQLMILLDVARSIYRERGK